MVRFRSILALLLMMIALGTSPAWAQSEEARAGARAAASQGVEAFEKGKWAEAVDLFTRAESLVHAPPHLLYIGRAEEKLGHLVKAHEAYVKIVRENLGPEAPAAFRKAQEDAQPLLSALKPRLPYLTIRLKNAGSNPVEVLMDDKPVPSALVGISHPADPGEHTLQAVLGSAKGEPVTVSLKEAERKEVEVIAPEPVPGEVFDEEAGELQTSAPGRGGRPAPAESRAQPSDGMHAFTIGGIAAVSLGAVGLGIGTVFGLNSMNTRSEIDALCGSSGSTCPASKDNPDIKPEVKKLEEDAANADTVAVIGFVTGGILVAGGVTMLFLGAIQSPSTAEAHVTPYVGLESVGVTGTF